MTKTPNTAAVAGKRSLRRRIIQCCVGVAGLTAAASQCLAADRSWINLAGGTFATSANWQNGLVAGINDVANFNNSSVFFPPGQADYTITFSSITQTQAVRVKNDFVTFDLAGRTYFTTSGAGSEVGTVGGGGSIQTARNARLTIQNGTVSTAANSPLTVGAATGGIGSLTVTTGGILTGAPRLLIGGASATGSLTVNGGTVSANLVEVGSGASSVGNAVITGPFSQLTAGSMTIGNAGNGAALVTIGAVVNTGALLLGNQSNGTLLINLGGVFQNNGTATIGSASDVRGVVTVDGSTARWIQSGTLLLGASGRGTINLINGGSVQAGNAIFTQGALNISGTNSSASFGDMILGKGGGGTINLTGGGRLQAGVGTLGSGDFFGTGAVNITGPDSHGTFTNLFVGETLVGLITVSDGGGLSCTGALTSLGVGTDSRGTARIMGTGSQWINSGTLMIGDRGQGTMTVTGGGRVQSNDAVVARGDIVANVTIDGPGSRWDIAGPLQIARFGLGSVNITNGGVVASGGGLLGLSSIGWGTILVSGADSRWTSTGSTVFGADDGAKGFVTISAGGSADALEAHVPLPAAEGATGLVVVTGANSRWTIASTLGIGVSSDPLVPVGGGHLEISAGGFVRSSHDLNVGERGTITLNGGTLVATVNGLTNHGTVSILSNPSHVSGKVNNQARGKIRVEGTQATFSNDVFNEGEFRVSPGGAAVLLRELDGTVPGTLIVDAGGTFTATRIVGQTVVVGGLVRTYPDGTNDGASRLRALSIDTGGQFDLSNNFMVINYNGESPLNLIGSYIASGFANGDWNGDGINSSIAAITPNRAIGFAEKRDIVAPLIFGGDLTSVLARYTIPGDVNLDQFVAIGDFAVLGANFNRTGYWAKGDFNYDNLVNIADFSLLAVNFNQSLPANVSWKTIPEPTGPLSAAVALLLSRRRFGPDRRRSLAPRFATSDRRLLTWLTPACDGRSQSGCRR